MAKSPSLTTPAKSALAIRETFVGKIVDHAAVQADPLLKQQAEWIDGVLRDFATAVQGRLDAEKANG